MIRSIQDARPVHTSMHMHAQRRVHQYFCFMRDEKIDISFVWQMEPQRRFSRPCGGRIDFDCFYTSIYSFLCAHFIYGGKNQSQEPHLSNAWKLFKGSMTFNPPLYFGKTAVSITLAGGAVWCCLSSWSAVARTSSFSWEGWFVFSPGKKRGEAFFYWENASTQKLSTYSTTEQRFWSMLTMLLG